MTFKSEIEVWRLIEDIPRSGSFNMAADQVLLENCNYDSRPVFRCYEWECPTISVGRNELLDESIDLDVCKNLGIPVVRRSTGGQSVLHGFDMTYSFVGVLRDSTFSGSVLKNYQYIAKGFYRFFEKLGLKPRYYVKRTTNEDLDSHVCFAKPSSYEILVEDRKIIGNAQKVRKIKTSNSSNSRIFLQHGSIPIKDKVLLIARIFPQENVRNLRFKMHSLESLGVFPRSTKNKLKQLLYKSFREVFGLEWEYKGWSKDELNLINNFEKNFKPIK